MRRSIGLLAGVAVIAMAVSGPAFSQGAQQTVTLMKVDPASLATGYRVSKVVGSTVYNEANENVGTIDDLIVTPSDTVPYAVLSVGGFLDMGTKYVVVPFKELQVNDNKMVLPGATKVSLKALPDFTYSKMPPAPAAAPVPAAAPAPVTK
jgi:sporulation protein YlmC with PRC-barrel domain